MKILKFLLRKLISFFNPMSKDLNIDYSKIDKDKFISDLKKSLYEMAFLDIERASKGNAKMGAFILSSCFIDYLAGFRYGKATTSKEYIKFTKKYFSKKYNAKKLYTDLRCKLVHNYSEGGSYLFVHEKPELHQTIPKTDPRTLINLENFISELKQALDKYFSELETDENIFKLAVNRYYKIGVIGLINL